jgi:hypothetical protein
LGRAPARLQPLRASKPIRSRVLSVPITRSAEGARRGREEASEVAGPDREEGASQAQAAKEDLTRQVGRVRCASALRMQPCSAISATLSLQGYVAVEASEDESRTRSENCRACQSSHLTSCGGCRGSGVVGFVLSPSSFACCWTAPGVRPSFSPITRVGVFSRISSRSALFSEGFQSLPCLEGGLCHVVLLHWRGLEDERVLACG